MKNSETREAATPGPLQATRVTPDGQYEVRSDFLTTEGAWEDRYVSFSGYFGSYGVALFVAAPDLLAAAREVLRVMDALGWQFLSCEKGHASGALSAAIAKATATAPASGGRDG